MGERRFLSLLFLFLTVFLLGCAYQPGNIAPATTPAPATPAPTAVETVETVHQTPTELHFGVKYRVKVLKVIDGDTIDVLMPDGSVERVRMLGVDTPEKTAEKNKPYEYDSITDLDYLAEWGRKAKEFAESTLEGKYAYIEFDERAGLRGYYGRLLAYVYLENGTDFTALLVKNGYARVYVEGSFEKENYYLQLESQARREGRGLWAYGHTEQRFSSTVVIDFVHYDAAGDDRYNLNDEYVVIRNTGNTSVNLQGWILKDEDGHSYVFPSLTLEPGEKVAVHTGSGVDSETDLYWNSSTPIWDNRGDAAYLLSPSGEVVDSYSW